jgi:hypothetical protein
VPDLWLTATLALCTITVVPHANADQPWAYRVGESGPQRQANFCDSAEAAMEIADIFERFGPRTGFSALASAPECSTRIHAVTPKALLRQVRIELNDGGEYIVNFIQVRTGSGTQPVLVTTRQLIED